MEIIPPVYSREHLPLSLQETCYLFLIGHLNQYPTDLLSLLPTMLRHQLLSRLPVFDLLNLENTSVTNEFEMTPYWKALSNNTNSTRPHLPFDESLSYNFKDILLDKILNQVTKPLRYKSRLDSSPRGCTCSRTHPNPLANLLSLPHWFPMPGVPDLLDVSDPINRYIKSICTSSGLQCICLYHNYVIPRHFESLYIGNPWKDWDQHVQTTIKMVLSMVAVDSLTHSIDYEYHDISSIFHKENDLVKQFLSYVHSIKLNCSSGNCIHHHKGPSHLSDHDPTDVFKTILSVQNPKLRKVKIPDSSSLRYVNTPFIVRQQLQSMVRFFAPGFGTPRNISDFTPYGGLVDLEISCLRDEVDSKGWRNQSTAYPLCQLAAIIAHQKHLRNVNLQGMFKQTSGCEILMTALAEFICKPTFESLSITGMEISHSHTESAEINCDWVIKLFVSFLTSHATCEQHLLFSNINFVGKCGRHRTLFSELPDDSQYRKNLSLTNVELGLGMIPVLSKIPPICLKSIKINQIRSCNCLNVFSNLNNIVTSELSLEFIFPLKGGKEIDKLIAPLLLNNKIKKLFFSTKRCLLYVALSEHLGLGILISEHAKRFKTLETIIIVNLSNFEPHEGVFYNSLIDLAQVVPLKLTLHAQQNYLEFFYTLFQERGLAQKIHRLEIQKDLVDSECSSLLMDISEELIHCCDYICIPL